MKKLVGVAIAATAMVAAVPASALTITFTDTLGPQLTELVDETLTLALFDDMGGTRILNSVMVSVDADVSSEGTLTNTSPNMNNFDFLQTVGNFDGTVITGPGSLQGLDVFVGGGFFGFVIGSESYSLAPAGSAGDTGTFGLFEHSDSDSFLITNAIDVADFVGPGSFSYDFNTTIGSAFSGGGGNVDTNFTTLAGATLTVVYDFDEVAIPVPAPAGIALFALGLLGMRRLRK